MEDDDSDGAYVSVSVTQPFFRLIDNFRTMVAERKQNVGRTINKALSI